MESTVFKNLNIFNEEYSKFRKKFSNLIQQVNKLKIIFVLMFIIVIVIIVFLIYHFNTNKKCPYANVSVQFGKRCLLSSFQLRDLFFTSSVNILRL
jgi:hypothetical protein